MNSAGFVLDSELLKYCCKRVFGARSDRACKAVVSFVCSGCFCCMACCSCVQWLSSCEVIPAPPAHLSLDLQHNVLMPQQNVLLQSCSNAALSRLVVSERAGSGYCIAGQRFCRESWRHIDCFLRGSTRWKPKFNGGKTTEWLKVEELTACIRLG